MPNVNPTITIEELRSRLKNFPDHYTIDFGGLTFYRIKQRGDEHVQMEFSQPVFLNKKTGMVVVQNLVEDEDSTDQ